MPQLNPDYFNKGDQPESNTAMITIPLDLPEVRVLASHVSAEGEIIITVESTLEGCHCQHCQQEIKALHQHDEWVSIRHLAILGRPSYIRLQPKRYNCVACAHRQGKKKVTTTQVMSWQMGQSPNSRAYEEQVLLQLVNSTIADVSIKENLGYDGVEGIVARHISPQVDWAKIEKLEVLGLDEIALKKGHQDFVALITARLDEGQLNILAVLPDRKKKTVKKFLQTIPQRLRTTLHTVCVDMWQPFIGAVEDVFGDEVKLTVDRYHLAKAYRAAADQVRKKELHRLKKALPKPEYKQLKGVMWAYRQRKTALSAPETDLLERFFAYAPEAQKAYDLREDLTAIFEQPLSKDAATTAITAWRTRVQLSTLTCFDAFLTTLDNHLDYITNYFVKRLNSGFVEGFNNKVKVIKRRCYGIFNVDHLFQRIFLDLEGYRLFAGVR